MTTSKAGIAIAGGTDPDQRVTQRHVTHSAVDPGNIMWEIIDVAINDTITSDRAATVFLFCGTLAFYKFYIAIMNIHIKHLCLIDINIDRLFMRGTINEQGES